MWKMIKKQWNRFQNHIKEVNRRHNSPIYRNRHSLAALAKAWEDMEKEMDREWDKKNKKEDEEK